METVFAFVVFLVLLHPRGCSPGVRHDAIGLIGLALLDGPYLVHEMVEIVVLILDLRVFRFGKTFFVAIEREREQGRIAILFRQGVFTFYREIRSTDLGTGHRKISALLAIQLFENGLTLLLRQTSQHERRRLGERTAETVYGLTAVIEVHHDSAIDSTFLKYHHFFLGTLVSGFGSEPYLTRRHLSRTCGKR